MSNNGCHEEVILCRFVFLPKDALKALRALAPVSAHAELKQGHPTFRGFLTFCRGQV